MKEYIERETVISIIKTAGLWEEEDREVAITCVEQTTAADVAEVRHGRWIFHFDHFTLYQKCSVCGFETPLVVIENEGGNVPLQAFPRMYRPHGQERRA